MGLKDKLVLLLLKPYVRRKARKALPQLDGSVAVSGLKGEVKIMRDQWGVPHIYADSLNDLAFAQGYVHAQDRLWQMELNRRVGRGRVSEVVGKVALDTDRAVRTLGFERLAKQDYEQLDSNLKTHIQDYCNGVNAFIEANEKKLPVEFALLKIKPTKWEPMDVMAFTRMLSWQMCTGWYGEIIRAKIIDKVGVEHAAEIEIHYPKTNPTTIDKHLETNVALDDGRLQAFNGPYLQPIKGSNAWAIASNRTDTGSPILCNDPHLPLTQPGIWYQNHLLGGDIHVSGVSLPAAPLVMIGHNENIAWGMTLAYTDTQDVFIEKFTDDTCTQYHFKDEIRNSTIIEERIKVKGEDDHVERVVITHHGPVISDILGNENKKLTLASKSLQQSGLLKAWYQLNRATGWNDFVDALKHMNTPALNVPYADVHGNIGYWCTGEVPMRKEGEHNVPSEGWKGEDEWTANVPFEEMPHVLNPAKGYVYTCNHKIVSDDYPYFLGNTWMNGYRANRLKKLFEAKEEFSIDDMCDMQMDTFCTPAPEFISHFKGLDLSGETLLLQQMNQQLTAWDGNLTQDSVGGCIFEIIRYYMVEVLITPQLGTELSSSFRGRGFSDNFSPQYEFWGYDTVVILRLLSDENSWWMKQAGGKKAVLIKCLQLAADHLTKTNGKDINQWHWGNHHKVTFHHMMGAQKPLDKIFSQGPYPLPGNTDTLLQTSNMGKAPIGDHIIAPSYRQIVDMGNLSNSRCVMPPGQSGNTTSPYYNNQLQLWLKGQYHPMLWERREVEEHAVHKLVLRN